MLAEFILIPAGVAVAAGAGGTPAVVASPDLASNGGIKGTSASSPGSTIGDQLASVGMTPIGGSTVRSRLQARLSQIAESTQPLILDAPASNPIDAETQAKLDLIAQYGQAAYDRLSADAKKKSAAELSKLLKLDPPLSGSESWEDIAKIAGGAAGLAFSPLPGGAVWGPIVGTYLGVKLEELLSKDSDKIKAWFKSRWADIESSIENAVHSTVDKVEGWFDSIF